MLETYRGTLHGDKIKWEADAPKISEKKNSVAVFVTIIDEVSVTNSPNGEKMAKVLGKLAAKGGISSIENATEWQREQRQERDLVGREK
ncbi:hypothetical protein BH20ACI1_BH20ACI1_11580 [soil metagenome]